jgi:Glycosyltransferase
MLGFFEPGDSAELARLVNEFVNDGEMRARYGENGRLRLNRLFSGRVVSQMVDSLYRSLVL